jgi:hypothetical protein
VNAFRQGALGPDLGYFPGGHRFLSDLSHLVRSSDLARVLVRTADTPRERAFAWGWVTHLLGDQAIHPLVGRGVGEVLLGDRDAFVDGAQDTGTHVQVETGLDAFYSRAFPGLRHRKMWPVFHGSSIRFLVQAYEAIYRASMDPTLFLVSHLATVRMSVQGLISIGVMSKALPDGQTSLPTAGAQRLLQQALAMVKRGLGCECLLLAYLNPIPPSEWLLKAVNEVVDSFAERFFFHFESGLQRLPNYNLDTGMVEDSPVTHPATLRTLLRLRSRTREYSISPRVSTRGHPSPHAGGSFPPVLSALGVVQTG